MRNSYVVLASAVVGSASGLQYAQGERSVVLDQNVVSVPEGKVETTDSNKPDVLDSVVSTSQQFQISSDGEVRLAEVEFALNQDTLQTLEDAQVSAAVLEAEAAFTADATASVEDVQDFSLPVEEDPTSKLDIVPIVPEPTPEGYFEAYVEHVDPEVPVDAVIEEEQQVVEETTVAPTIVEVIEEVVVQPIKDTIIDPLVKVVTVNPAITNKMVEQEEQAELKESTNPENLLTGTPALEERLEQLEAEQAQNFLQTRRTLKSVVLAPEAEPVFDPQVYVEEAPVESIQVSKPVEPQIFVMPPEPEPQVFILPDPKEPYVQTVTDFWTKVEGVRANNKALIRTTKDRLEQGLLNEMPTIGDVMSNAEYLRLRNAAPILLTDADSQEVAAYGQLVADHYAKYDKSIPAIEKSLFDSVFDTMKGVVFSTTTDNLPIPSVSLPAIETEQEPEILVEDQIEFKPTVVEEEPQILVKLITTTPAPTPIEEITTTTTAAAVIEEITTTTTAVAVVEETTTTTTPAAVAVVEPAHPVAKATDSTAAAAVAEVKAHSAEAEAAALAAVKEIQAKTVAAVKEIETQAALAKVKAYDQEVTVKRFPDEPIPEATHNVALSGAIGSFLQVSDVYMPIGTLQADIAPTMTTTAAPSAPYTTRATVLSEIEKFRKSAEIVDPKTVLEEKRAALESVFNMVGRTSNVNYWTPEDIVNNYFSTISTTFHNLQTIEDQRKTIIEKAINRAPVYPSGPTTVTDRTNFQAQVKAHYAKYAAQVKELDDMIAQQLTSAKQWVEPGSPSAAVGFGFAYDPYDYLVSCFAQTKKAGLELTPANLAKHLTFLQTRDAVLDETKIEEHAAKTEDKEEQGFFAALSSFISSFAKKEEDLEVVPPGAIKVVDSNGNVKYLTVQQIEESNANATSVAAPPTGFLQKSSSTSSKQAALSSTSGHRKHTSFIATTKSGKTYLSKDAFMSKCMKYGNTATKEILSQPAAISLIESMLKHEGITLDQKQMEDLKGIANIDDSAVKSMCEDTFQDMLDGKLDFEGNPIEHLNAKEKAFQKQLLSGEFLPKYTPTNSKKDRI